METRRLMGFVVSQRDDVAAIRFFVTVVDARDALKWTAVDRVAERKGGIQRLQSESRTNAIARFFKHPRNVIPTSAVVAFKAGVAVFTAVPLGAAMVTGALLGPRVEWGCLQFDFDDVNPQAERPAFVVDGQHRLFGMARLPSSVPMLVSALLDADPDEQAFQFVVINNKAAKVSADLVRSLLVDFSEDNLEPRLKTARVSLSAKAGLVAIADDDSDSPIREMVDWDRRRGQGDPRIKPLAIESSLAYVRRAFPALDTDEDSLIDFFFAIWWGSKDALAPLWQRDASSHLFEGAAFRALSEYLVDEIESLAGLDYVEITAPDDVRKVARTIVTQIGEDLWTSDWGLKSLDTSAGRDIIKRDLRRIRQNRKDSALWNDGLALLGTA